MAADSALSASHAELRRTLECHRAALGDLFQEWSQEVSRLSQDQLLRQERLVKRLGLAQPVAIDINTGEQCSHTESCESSVLCKARDWLEAGKPDQTDALSETQSRKSSKRRMQEATDPPSDTPSRKSSEQSMQDSLDMNSARKQLLTAVMRKGRTSASLNSSGVNKDSDLEPRNSTASSLSGSQSGNTLRFILQHVYFRVFVSAAILLNATSMAVHAQYELNALIETGEGTDPVVWEYLEQAFCLFFILELGLRLLGEGKHFWRWRSEEAPWNLFDTILVIFSVFDLISTWARSSGNKSFNLNFARTLRILRFARILRVIRVMRFFHSFRLMVYSILHSMVSLMWVFLLLSFIMYSFSAFFLHGVTDFFRSLGDSPSAHEQRLANTLKHAFGSAPIACRSLFMGISGGRDWVELMEPLSEIGWFYGVVFVLYVFFMIFGVLNVVIGIFVDCSNDISQRNREIVTKNEMDKNKSYAEHLRRFFHEADTDNTGTLSWEEFETYLKDVHVQAYFQSFELDVSQARTLFDLLDLDGSNDVEIDEFVQGCMRLKGQARSIDVNILLYESEKILSKQSAFMEIMDERFDHLERICTEDSTTAIGRSQTLFL